MILDPGAAKKCKHASIKAAKSDTSRLCDISDIIFSEYKVQDLDPRHHLTRTRTGTKLDFFAIQHRPNSRMT